MSLFQRVLVCVSPEAVFDAKGPAEETVALARTAASIASRSHGSVTFFGVVPMPHRSTSSAAPLGLQMDPAELEKKVSGTAGKGLAKLVETCVATGVAADAKVACGSAWREILREVTSGNYDLVMVGTGKHGHMYRAVFGSTAMKLLRFCPSPVLVQRHPESPVEIPEAVLSIDVADGQEVLLNRGVEAARLIDARLHIVHAVNPPYAHALRVSGMTEVQIEEYRERYRKDAEKWVNERLSQTDYRTLAHGTQVHFIDGPPEQVILRFLADHPVDVLMLGTSGRTGLSGMMIGNTCERLLPEVSCSVLAFKPEGFTCPVDLGD